MAKTNFTSEVKSISYSNTVPITQNTPINAADKDTIALIRYHIKEADKNKTKGLYSMSYQHLWDAMLLAEAINNINKLKIIHDELGVLYGIYGKHEEAIKHKHLSLEYAKSIYNSGKKKLSRLSSAYYNLAVQYRKAEAYDKALVYIDSCSIAEKWIFKEDKSNPYVLVEKGNIYQLTGMLQEAEVLLLESRDLFEIENASYLVVVYFFLGDLYSKLLNLDTAILFYEKSLNKMAEVKEHIDYKSDISKKLAELLKQKGQLKKAYFHLNESNKIADSLFNVRSANNSQLFEIKNSYEEAILEKDTRINQQKNVIARKETIQTRLVFTIASILLGVIVLAVILYYKARVRKLKLEQKDAAMKADYEREKVNAVLETKSKELTASALQIIEKDKHIDTLLKTLKEESPQGYKSVKDVVVKGNKDMWERFNLRFTEVNSGFYTRLREKHPNLTPTEHKHCALIKLRFDSKEMAKLLNISITSVHISRHRIRKKIGLEREDNLSKYIQSI
ncbi:MAG: hypothetical protein ACON5F_11005 [Jejuia sp.]